MKRMLSAFLFCLSLTFALESGASDARYSPAECPVVGNTSSHIFHVPGGSSYAKMLIKNQGSDNRQCFKTEGEAESAGYRKAKR